MLIRNIHYNCLFDLRRLRKMRCLQNSKNFAVSKLKILIHFSNFRKSRIFECPRKLHFLGHKSKICRPEHIVFGGHKNKFLELKEKLRFS